MASLILQPCGDSDANKHYVDTIQNPISVERIKKFLSKDELVLLEPIFKGRDAIPVWGVTPGKKNGNANKWNRIRTGDIALFSKQGKIFATSTVVDKVHNKQLALELWQTNSDGNTWEYVYFLDELVNQNITYLQFNKAIGYSDNYIIQGFNVIDTDKSLKAIASLDFFSNRYSEPIQEQEFEKAVDFLCDLENTDTEVKTKARLEQGFLRKVLFGKNVISACCICGEEFPVDMICASHIKKRSACTHEERLDFKNIVAPMCVNGCDAIFEKGYIVVNDSGIIEPGRANIKTTGLSRKIQSVSGLLCKAWNNKNEKYFNWHRLRFI